MRVTPLTRLVGLLVLMVTPVLAQGAGSGTATGAAGSPGSDWPSLWWILGAVVVLVLAAIFISAWRQRP